MTASLKPCFFDLLSGPRLLFNGPVGKRCNPSILQLTVRLMSLQLEFSVPLPEHFRDSASACFFVRHGLFH